MQARSKILKAAWGACLLVLAACSEKDLGAGPAPASETDIIGTWRAAIPIPGGSTIVKVTMEIKADHTLIVSQKLAGVVPGNPQLEVDQAKETFTWTLQAGVLKSVKTQCEYGKEPDYQLKSESCQLPLDKEASVAISGNSWTVLENRTTYTFIKDAH
jgi:hypothetical protein